MSSTFREVKSDILSKIVQGNWPPGELIPNEIDLAARYGCARATVNRALRELSDEGIVERRRKAGTRDAQLRIQTPLPLSQEARATRALV